MRHVSCALLLVITFGCSNDPGVSFDPRVSRGILTETRPFKARLTEAF